MGAIEDYEKLLKEAVSAKRLSASKMQAITDIAMKNLENDTQLISILYRTHKSLPSAHKVPSLYIFDALARAARSKSNKTGADTKSERGNAATFLAKMEGVLDGLVQDMVSHGTNEAKEKTKKVLDIWVKANTFPPATMSRLTGIANLKGDGTAESTSGTTSRSEKETSGAVVNSSQQTNSNGAPASSAPAGNLGNLPPAILALLAQAQASAGVNQANPSSIVQPPSLPSSIPLQQSVSSNSQPTNGSSVLSQTPISSLDPASLALLQHLAGAPGGNLAVNPPNPLFQQQSSTPTGRWPMGAPLAGQNQPSTQFSQIPSGSSTHSIHALTNRTAGYTDDRYDGGPPFRDDYNSDSRGNRFGPGHSDRRDSYNERSRPHDDRNREKEREYPSARWSGHGRGGPKRGSVERFEREQGLGKRRSRSPPPRREGFRGPPPYSPPRRERVPRPSPPPPLPGLDEFGRELRPQATSLSNTQQPSENSPNHDTKASSDVSMSPTDPAENGAKVDEPRSESPRTESTAGTQRSTPTTQPRASRWGVKPTSRGPSVEAGNVVDYQASIGISTPSTSNPLKPTQPTTNSVGVLSQGTGGIDAFDFSTFDPSNAESWAALGKAWEVTYGRPPTFEEMNQVMMMQIGMVTAPALALEADESGTYANSVGGVGDQQYQTEDWNQTSGSTHSGVGYGGVAGRGWGGGGRGRGGGSSYGDGYGGFNTDPGWQDSSEAIVVGGSDPMGPITGHASNYQMGNSEQEPIGPTPPDIASLSSQDPPDSPKDMATGSIGGPGGRMIRIGDRWQWVKK